MDNVKIKAQARVKLTKLDADNNVIGVEEHLVDLTNEEAEKLWHSQQQA